MNDSHPVRPAHSSSQGHRSHDVTYGWDPRGVCECGEDGVSAVIVTRQPGITTTRNCAILCCEDCMEVEFATHVVFSDDRNLRVQEVVIRIFRDGESWRLPDTATYDVFQLAGGNHLPSLAPGRLFVFSGSGNYVNGDSGFRCVGKAVPCPRCVSGSLTPISLGHVRCNKCGGEW